MTRLLLFLLIMGLATACGKSEKPKDLIPEIKMERVIWDMVQADEFITNYVLKDSAKVNINAERYKLYQQVLSLHSITKEQFKKSYDYYASRPGESKVLFDSLSARANRRMQDSYKPTPLQAQ
jgi:Domain of unknown function (DUF4296)